MPWRAMPSLAPTRSSRTCDSSKSWCLPSCSGVFIASSYVGVVQPDPSLGHARTVVRQNCDKREGPGTGTDSGGRRRGVEVERALHRAGRALERRGIARAEHELAAVAAVQEHGIRADADLGVSALDLGQGLREVALLAAHPERLL